MPCQNVKTTQTLKSDLTSSDSDTLKRWVSCTQNEECRCYVNKTQSCQKAPQQMDLVHSRFNFSRNISSLECSIWNESVFESVVNKLLGWSGCWVASRLDLCAPWNGTASQNSQWQMPSSPLCYLEPKGSGIQPPAVLLWCGPLLQDREEGRPEAARTDSARLGCLSVIDSCSGRAWSLNKWGQTHQGRPLVWGI